MESGREPLIVTAHLDQAAFAELDGLRRRHFPPERNMIPAHVSLFHHLPGEETGSVMATLVETCRSEECPVLRPAGLRFLGRGVALAYRSAELSRLHDELATRWHGWLTAQDRQPFQAHVTIQNKVDPAVARALRDGLAGYQAPACTVEGLTLWRYLGGPWERVGTAPFRSAG